MLVQLQLQKQPNKFLLTKAVSNEAAFNIGENMDRIEKQFGFIAEIDKEKKINRRTYLSDGSRVENDSEHAWHAALMAIILSEYSNEKIDVLKTVKMILIHDIVEIDAGDTYAYDEEGIKTQAEREEKAAKRIFHLLPDDQAEDFYSLWHEFEESETPESKFARAMDNVQPNLLNHLTNGRLWEENKIRLSQVLKRNSKTARGSKTLWNYQFEQLIKPHIEKQIINDKESQ